MRKLFLGKYEMGLKDDEFKENAILKAFDNSQNMITIADSKANLSITIQSLIITIGLGSSLLANIFGKLWDFNRKFFWLYFVFILIFTLTSMLGVIFSILVYKARFPKDKAERIRKGFLYHEHIAEHQDSDEYYSKVIGNKKEDILEDFAKQTYSVALIASRKMKFVNYSIWFLMANIFLAIILLVLSGILVII